MLINGTCIMGTAWRDGVARKEYCDGREACIPRSLPRVPPSRMPSRLDDTLYRLVQATIERIPGDQPGH
jgi:hypothetical protein